MHESQVNFSRVSVAVVCTCGAHELSRCLGALRKQHAAPPFDITVVCDPGVRNLEAARESPDIRIVINTDQSTPLQLASRALHECDGELILLTKDHCVPGADWVRTMVDAQRADRAVVGGRVEVARDASATDWAFYFVDFFRYAGPLAEGPTRSLTICNVAYKRRELDTFRDVWEKAFVETSVNEALRSRFGVLWLEPASEVTMHRHLTLRAAMRERYVLGRIFGHSRLAASSAARRAFLAVCSPALPFVFLGRMAAAALRSRRQTAAFVRSLAPLTLIVLARSFGEWLAYVTGRPPRSSARSG